MIHKHNKLKQTFSFDRLNIYCIIHTKHQEPSIMLSARWQQNIHENFTFERTIRISHLAIKINKKFDMLQFKKFIIKKQKKKL